MNKDVMAEAITGIDDNLIEEAQEVSKKHRRMRPFYSIVAIAACLVLVFTFIFTSGNAGNTYGLFMNGSEISKEPIAVDAPVAAYARKVIGEQTVSLSLKTKEPTKITISGGIMSVCSAGNTDTLYYKGNEYTTDIPVNIHWTIDGSDIKSDYTLTLNEGEIVYSLSYDESDSYWSICKR